MMNFHVLTLFPEMVLNGLNTSITGKAVKNGLINIEATDIRNYSLHLKPLPPQMKFIKQVLRLTKFMLCITLIESFGTYI